MKTTASGGTDAANIVLFWPDNLAADADMALKDDPITVVQNLREEGKLIWFPCAGDGGCTVTIYVGCEVPDELIVHCRDEEVIPALIVRGVGYFGGAEYMFKSDSSFLAKYPKMCGEVRIPDGTYAAHVYRTEFPESLYDLWLLNQVGVGAKRFWHIHGLISARSVGLVITLFASFIFVSWNAWFCILAAAAICVFVALGMSRTKWYKAAAKARDHFGKAYPNYVVHLE